MTQQAVRTMQEEEDRRFFELVGALESEELVPGHSPLDLVEADPGLEFGPGHAPLASAPFPGSSRAPFERMLVTATRTRG